MNLQHYCCVSLTHIYTGCEFLKGCFFEKNHTLVYIQTVRIRIAHKNFGTNIHAIRGPPVLTRAYGFNTCTRLVLGILMLDPSLVFEKLYSFSKFINCGVFYFV